MIRQNTPLSPDIVNDPRYKNLCHLLYDVIVVGAGPAGSSTAYECSKRGLKVLLLDQKKRVGIPKQCGEGINKQVLKELNLKLKPEWISRETDSLVVFNFEKYLKGKGKRGQGIVLDRKKFDPGLVERARKAGAEVRLGCKVKDLSKEGVVCGDKEIKGKIIVGADGPNTLIGEKSGLGKPKCGFGLQYEIKTGKTRFPNSLQFHFSKDAGTGGYFWIFPKKETLNVGVVSLEIRDLKPALDSFVKKMGWEKEKIKEVNAGLIPFHGPSENFCQGNILLVGDAAGHANPMSGGGIPAAIFDGILAAEVIEKHLKEGKSLSDYQKKWWKSDFGKATKQAFKLRKMLLKFLEKDKLDHYLNKLGDREITSRKDLLKLGMKINPIVFLKFFKACWSFRKGFKYAW